MSTPPLPPPPPIATHEMRTPPPYRGLGDLYFTMYTARLGITFATVMLCSEVHTAGPFALLAQTRQSKTG